MIGGSYRRFSCNFSFQIAVLKFYITTAVQIRNESFCGGIRIGLGGAANLVYLMAYDRYVSTSAGRLFEFRIVLTMKTSVVTDCAYLLMESTIFDGTTEEKCKNNNNETGIIRKEDADRASAWGGVARRKGGHAQTRKCFAAGGHEKEFFGRPKNAVRSKNTLKFIYVSVYLFVFFFYFY